MPPFKPYSQNQTQLLPPSLDEFIDKDHIARLLSHAVDTMDLSFIENTYSPFGQHAYDPKMLTKIILYGYTIGVRSSRKLANKCQEDVVLMWIASRQTPDFRTISLFRKDKMKDVKKVFEQVLTVCFDLGMIRVGKVSVDGTTLRADANKNKMQYRKILESRRAKLRQQIDDMFAEAERLDKEEDDIYGATTPHTTGIPLTEELKRKMTERLKKEWKRRISEIERRKKTIAKKTQEFQVTQLEIGKKLRVIRQDRNSMSTTDKDATCMLMKEQYPAPGYNAQFATEHQVILGYKLSSDRNDSKLMRPVIEEVKERTHRKPQMVGADAGYGNKKTYRYLKQQRIAAFIPYNNYNHEITLRNKGLYTLPKNYDAELERYKWRVRLRLKSDEGKEMMKRRREDIEPVIGDIKRNMNFRGFNLRGKWKCEIELGLISIGHNLKKIKEWVKKLVEWDSGLQKAQELGKVLGYVTV
jgi:transposase